METSHHRRLATAALGAAAACLALAATATISGPSVSRALQRAAPAAQHPVDAPAELSDYLLWTSPHLLLSNWSQSIQPRVAVDTSDRLHVIWMDGQFGAAIPWLPWTIYYARRGTGGAWTVPTVLGEGISPSIAADGADNVHMVWVDKGGSGGSQTYGVFHLTWSGTTQTWGARQAVMEYAWSPYVDEWPLETAIAADNLGNLHVAWVHKRDSRRDIKYRSYSAASPLGFPCRSGSHNFTIHARLWYTICSLPP